MHGGENVIAAYVVGQGEEGKYDQLQQRTYEFGILKWLGACPEFFTYEKTTF